MLERELKEMLEAVAAGRIGPDAALDRLRRLPFEQVDGVATLDTHRALRCGFSEVLLAEGKTPEQCARIAARLAEGGGPFLATRVDEERARAILGAVPDAEHHPAARLVRRLPDGPPDEEAPGPVAVVSAGTADIQVAEEALLTLETMGVRADRIYDVGVAGVHRLLAHRGQLDRAVAVVVVAGMEGALPSVVGGLVSVPVIAVPTSVGYGVARGGWAALLGMLATCASGVVVVNIDNGFGAGYAAGRIVLGVPAETDEETDRADGEGGER
jgi:NCAIR mutase (PurE)-related protein